MQPVPIRPNPGLENHEQAKGIGRITQANNSIKSTLDQLKDYECQLGRLYSVVISKFFFSESFDVAWNGTRPTYIWSSLIGLFADHF